MHSRRRSIGAEVTDRGVDFRVWAPDHRDVRVVIEGAEFPLEREADGYFRGVIAEAHAGKRYRFRIDGQRETFPDPASRFQPEEPHGDSEVIDPRMYHWRDHAWRGVAPRDRLLCEMRAGTFTQGGKWHDAIGHLAYLAAKRDRRVRAQVPNLGEARGDREDGPGRGRALRDRRRDPGHQGRARVSAVRAWISKRRANNIRATQSRPATNAP